MGPEVVVGSSSSGSLDGLVNVDSAALSAASTTAADPPLDFGEEPASDAGFDTGRCVEGDGDTE